MKAKMMMKKKDMMMGQGMKKGKHVGGKAKVKVVMKEFKKGKLRSGSGRAVKNPKQAVAIAMSEAGISKKKKSKK